MTRHERRSPLVLALLVAVAGFLAGAVRPAEAGVSFHVGGGFTVGGLRFQVGVHDHDPVRYYRLDRPLVVAGAHCTDRCYVRGSYHYHHPSCPLVRSYFDRHGYRPVDVYGPISPRPYVVRPAPRHSYHVPYYPSYRTHRAPLHDSHWRRHHGTRHDRHDWDHDRRRDHRRRHHDRHDRRGHRGRSGHHDHRRHR